MKDYDNEIKELKNKIIKLEEENDKLKSENNSLNNKIKEQEKVINNMKIKKEENEKINDSINYNKDKIILLMEELKLKEKQINELKSKSEINQLMTVIFVSADKKIHYSLICKKNDIFTKIENMLYNIYPEYKESENYFIANGNKVNKYKTLEENKIKFSDIITLNIYNIEEKNINENNNMMIFNKFEI